jgi:hypothetical protein
MRDLDPAADEKLQQVRKFYTAAEPTHLHQRLKFEKYYKLYRSWREMRSQVHADGSTRRDVREVMDQARIGFGTPLFIPMAFGVVETILPRMLSTEPHMLLTPDDPASEGNMENIKLITTKQQQRTRFGLRCQTVAKSGLMYGIGVGDTIWDKQTKLSPKLQEAMVPLTGPDGRPVPTPDPVNPGLQAVNPDGSPMFQMVPKWVPGPPEEQIKYAGPLLEPIDIFDWIWDPDSYDAETMEEGIHRTWRSDLYCTKMFESDVWHLPDGWTLEDALRGGSRSKRDEVWSGRQSVTGDPSMAPGERETHEVWTYRTGSEVIIVLDRHLPVAWGPNPWWHGQSGWSVYRPTEVPHEMVGIGEIEAIEDLQREINEMRTQRRDNATLVLQRPLAYFEGFLDPSQIEFGAAKMWPVDGPPSELIFPIPLQDIPFSSYREEDSLKADIDRAIGLSDSVMGGDSPGAPETATGLQLVHAAAGIRVQFKTRRFEVETVAHIAEMWTSLNQQHIVEEDVVAGPPQPGDGDAEYRWYPVGPAQLAGSWTFSIDAGSMSPQNDVAKMQEAIEKYNLLRPDPILDPRKYLPEILRSMGFKNPEAIMVPDMPDVPFAALDLVRDTLAQEQGIDPHEFEALVQEAVQQVEQGATDPTFGSAGDQIPGSRQVSSPTPPGPGGPNA